MARYFVYVNENSTMKHVKVHCELRGPCGHVLKQIVAGNVEVSCSIISLVPDKSVLKIGITDNSYWLLVWADSPQGAASNPIVQQIANRLGVTITYCNDCCEPADELLEPST